MEKIGGTAAGGARDGRGRPLPLERRILITKIKKYRWGQQRLQLEVETELKRLRSAMGIPRPCIEQALEIYRQALEKELVRGRSVEAMAAAALYMACRMMKMPRPLDEFVRYTKASRKKVARYYRLLLQELNVKVPVSDPMLYISRIAQQLGLSGEVVKTAIEILQKAKEAGITAGKDPASLAAAAAYIASLMHGDYRPRRHFVVAAGATDLTVRSRYRELWRLLIVPRLRIEKEVEVNGKTYVVKVMGGEAVVEDRGNRKLLRIRITAEVGRIEGGHVVGPVVREYTITFGRYGADNVAKGIAAARADAPGGREADAERLVAVIKALTGREPRVSKRGDGKIEVICNRTHLEGFRRFAELADAVERWLGE
jgi:transcription initiation factor TFIIIB Brf1 subunit/transcription initiation factor TFIIB